MFVRGRASWGRQATNFSLHFHDFLGERGGLVVIMPRAPDPKVGVRAPLGSNRVVSLSKAHLLPESIGNTQEVVAPSQHD